MVDNGVPEYEYKENLNYKSVIPPTLTSFDDQSHPVTVGVEWLTGTGPRHHDFGNEDQFTEMLRQHEHIQDVKQQIAEDINDGEYALIGSEDYSLAGLSGVPKYIADYSTLSTFGLAGNLAVTYLGSYALDYYVMEVNQETGEAIVLFHASNSSTLASATRPPVLGYTDFWAENVSPVINNILPDGATSKVSQDFWWFETINLNE